MDVEQMRGHNTEPYSTVKWGDWKAGKFCRDRNSLAILKYILLDVLLRSIAEYFYELCRISKYKQRVKIHSDTTQQNV